MIKNAVKEQRLKYVTFECMYVYLWKVKVGMDAEFDQRLKDAKTQITLSWLVDRLANYH